MPEVRRLSRIAAVVLVLAAVLIGGLRDSGRSARSDGGHATAVTLTSATVRTTSATSSGGLCSVWGIGDIGQLFHFCSLGSGLTGTLNNLCAPGVPEPESATAGVDSLIRPPSGGKQIATPYNQYGMAGQFWAATDLQCSDMTSLIGNDVAGMLFDFAKSIDRVTITVYQSAAGEGILSWLQNVTDRLVSGLGKAIYFPYLAVVVILATIWLAWQGLIRKRGTRTIEGVLWMVFAAVTAIWLIGRPADFTGLGKSLSDGISTTLNSAFAHLPSPGQASCLPVGTRDPQISKASFAYTAGPTVVDQNANELWTVLVCKPWLDGEFGTTAFSTAPGHASPVNSYARQLLWAQAIAANEHPTAALIQAKQATYVGIAQTIKQRNPSIYPLFQGKEWTSRLEIGFAALLAALIAGVLVLLISVTLILLKLGFLLLLIAGPFFLLIGTHPGFGRVIAMRWIELLIGVLLKQIAVALALSVLLYCYALIMGTSDAVLPWALKILMITLVTVAVFIYRKPFQHLFAAVGYGAIGSTELAEADLNRAVAAGRANTAGAATIMVPGFAAYRAARWARRNPAQAAGLAISATTGTSLAAGAGAAASAEGQASADSRDFAAAGAADVAAAGRVPAGRARAREAVAPAASQAPPLRLPKSAGAPAAAAGPATPRPPARARPAAARTRSGPDDRWPGGTPGSSAAPALPLTRSAGGSVRRDGPGPARAPGGSGTAAQPRPASSPRRSSPPPRSVPPPRSRASASPGGSGQPPVRRAAVRSLWSSAGGNGAASRPADGRRVTRPERSPWLARRPADSGERGSLDHPMPSGGGSAGQAGESQSGPFWLRPFWRRK